jgi:hypothetical protein
MYSNPEYAVFTSEVILVQINLMLKLLVMAVFKIVYNIHLDDLRKTTAYITPLSSQQSIVICVGTSLKQVGLIYFLQKYSTCVSAGGQ